jgi:hypothetical protein
MWSKGKMRKLIETPNNTISLSFFYQPVSTIQPMELLKKQEAANIAA